MVNHSRDRGQLILIGAIALAFIILGIVVVFNGVVYTETLSSGSTSQSATAAEKTELEIEHGIACLLKEVNGDDDEIEDFAEENISAFSEAYLNSTAKSTPAVVDIQDFENNVDTDDDGELNAATVRITYDSNDLSYEQTREIDPDECDS